jgi:hypothetical protein
MEQDMIPRIHSSIPRRVRKRILANVEAVVDRFGNDADHQEEMIDHLIDISYDSYHIGWQAGFIDDTQEDPELKDFNPGGTSDD